MSAETLPHYFTNRNRSLLVQADTWERINRYRQGSLIEIDYDEYQFIEDHWPDDPEWIARYGYLDDKDAQP